MWETIILLAIYLVLGLLCLAVAGWGVVTGQFLDVDGLFLVLVCLSLAVVFLAAFALAIRRGEFAAVMKGLRRSQAATLPETPGPEAPGQAEATNPSRQQANQ